MSQTPQTVGAAARVQLVDLHRSFGGATKALDGLSIDIAPGELLALLGPSGCGKTTALRVVAGFEHADGGRVLVNGRDISGVPPQKRDMGMVFQSYSLFPNMNALDNVGYGLRLRKLNRGERDTKAGELLEMVGLTSQIKKYPHQMSGGQQQRVALARALAFEPRVLLLDEPLSALDAKVRVQLREQIRAIQSRMGITTLFVTHDQEEALSMADRVCVMRQGRIEQVAAPAELYSRPATPFVAEFVGTMNRIPASVDGSRIAALGQAIPCRNLGERSSGALVDVMVRPEELRLAATSGGRGVVTTKTFLGSVTRIGVILDGDNAVKVDVTSEQAERTELGAQVEVTIAADEVMIDDHRGDRAAPASAPAHS